MSKKLSTEEMQAALVKVYGPQAAPKDKDDSFSVADLLADGAAMTVAAVSEFGDNTSSFVERVSTRYQFQRAVRKGDIKLEAPKAAPKGAKPKAA